MILGEDCDIAAHITRLEDFKPLSDKPVTMELTIEGKTQKATLEKPQTPGIYRFEIEPATAGCGRLVFYVEDDTLRSGHIHVAASHEALHHHEGEEHHHEGEEHHHEGHEHSHAAAPTNAVTFTKEQSWKVDFATIETHTERFGSVIRTSAQVMPSQGDEREVTAKASGIVVMRNPDLVEGSAVKAGQPLFSIESSGMADNNMNVRFQEASAAYSVAKSEYERKQQLAADRIVGQAELQRAKAEYESAKAVYDNLKDNFSQNGAVVASPMSGYVKCAHVKNGSFVEAGYPVVTVSQNRDLWIRAEVQPRYYPQLQHIVSATLVIPSTGTTYTLEQLGGSLVDYGKGSDGSNPLIPVTFRVRNAAELVPGSFVTLYIRSESEGEAVAIPNEGIVEELGSCFVFVQINPELFEKRPVTLGPTDGTRTVIASGIKAGERVVSRGAMMVKLAQSAAALDPHAGHVHSH